MDDNDKVSKLLQRYQELLRQEADYQAAEEDELLQSVLGEGNKVRLSVLKRAGLARVNLRIEGKRSGFGSRTIVELVDRHEIGNEDGRVIFKGGELIRLIIKKGSELLTTDRVTGTVMKSSTTSIHVAIDGEEDDFFEDDGEDVRVAVVKLANQTSFERMREALIKAGKLGNDVLVRKVLEAALTEEEKDALNDSYNTTVQFIDETLNESQREAVTLAMNAKELALIHGPPGTGKTQTITEIVRQHLHNSKGKMRILLCGPSNISVDNLLERLLRKDHDLANSDNWKLIRLGHPGRILEDLHSFTLDYWLSRSDQGKLLSDINNEINEIVGKKLSKSKSRGERQELYGELRVLRRERRERAKNLEVDLIKEADVILATLNMCGSRVMQGQAFDLIVIDEASQALLPDTLLPLLLGKGKVILVGDHYQLPPTVQSPRAEVEGLAMTLFEKLIMKRKVKSSVMLTVQYRMNRVIAGWSNDRFYGGQLRAHKSVSEHRLEIKSMDDDGSGKLDPLVFYDTAGFDSFFETTNNTNNTNNTGNSELSILRVKAEEASRMNQGEANLAVKHCLLLLKVGISPVEIAIISPYSAQVSLIRSLLTSNDSITPETLSALEIGSIDGFQGREKTAIILSLVRSNPEGNVGFLGDLRRLNVGLTRARRHLCVIGDGGTVRRNEELAGLMEYLEENGSLQFPE